VKLLTKERTSEISAFERITHGGCVTVITGIITALDTCLGEQRAHHTCAQARPVPAVLLHVTVSRSCDNPHRVAFGPRFSSSRSIRLPISTSLAFPTRSTRQSSVAPCAAPPLSCWCTSRHPCNMNRMPPLASLAKGMRGPRDVQRGITPAAALKRKKQTSIQAAPTMLTRHQTCGACFPSHLVP